LGFIKGIKMKKYIRWLPLLVLSLGSPSSFSQQTYLSQHNQTKKDASQLLSDVNTSVFVNNLTREQLN
jgi:hypothetical protein